MILDKLFQLMSEKNASDIFISAGAPIHIKIQGETMPVNQQIMLPDMIEKIAYELMSPDQIKTFEANWEMNLSFGVPNVGNFRVNIFRQRGSVGIEPSSSVPMFSFRRRVWSSNPFVAASFAACNAPASSPERCN